MTKIQITKSLPTIEEVEVEFPLYLSWDEVYDYSSGRTEVRVEENGRMISIDDTYHHDTNGKLTLEISQINVSTELGYYLTDRSIYRSTEAKFNAALAALQEALK